MNLPKSPTAILFRQESVEVTPVGTQDGKEQRPAAIKSQPVPATTLRESHWSCMDLHGFAKPWILGYVGMLGFVEVC